MSETLSALPQMNVFTGELVEPLISKAVFYSSLAHRYAQGARTKKILRSLSDEQLRDDAPLPRRDGPGRVINVLWPELTTLPANEVAGFFATCLFGHRT